MTQILVTGGAGFIGSHVVDHLIAMGKKVIVLDDLSGGFADNINPKASFIRGSILNHKLVTSIFENNRIQYILHLAAYAAEGLSHFIKRYNYQNNVIGSINLINAAVNYNVSCFVYTSSIAVYGANASPLSEDMIPKPVDSYGIAKHTVEQELEISHDLFGLNYIIFRPHNVYGERQNIGDKYRNVIGIFMNQIMNGLPLTIFGDGFQVRAFTHIQDVAPLLAKSIQRREAYNQTFNVGSDTPTSINSLAQAVMQAMDSKARIRYLPERDEVKIAYCSHRKLMERLNCTATCELSNGLQKMARWAISNGAKKSKPFKHIEIKKNLPSAWLE